MIDHRFSRFKLFDHTYESKVFIFFFLWFWISKLVIILCSVFFFLLSGIVQFLFIFTIFLYFYKNFLNQNFFSYNFLIILLSILIHFIQTPCIVFNFIRVYCIHITTNIFVISVYYLYAQVDDKCSSDRSLSNDCSSSLTRNRFNSDINFCFKFLCWNINKAIKHACSINRKNRNQNKQHSNWIHANFSTR